jgi:hypothetical protein
MTCDPGSLTRHRKRIHAYEPKSHREARNGKELTTKKSVRISPYSRTKVTKCALYEVPPVQVDAPDSQCPSVSPLPSHRLELPPPSGTTSEPESCPTPSWDKTQANEILAAILDLMPQIPEIPSPKQLFPALAAPGIYTADLYPDPSFSPIPQYATAVPTYQDSWSLSEYQDIPPMVQVPSKDVFSVSWDQVYNPPSPTTAFSSATSWFGSPIPSPLSSTFSEDCASPLTPQEYQPFLEIF